MIFVLLFSFSATFSGDGDPEFVKVIVYSSITMTNHAATLNGTYVIHEKLFVGTFRDKKRNPQL